MFAVEIVVDEFVCAVLHGVTGEPARTTIEHFELFEDELTVCRGDCALGVIGEDEADKFIFR